MITRNIIASGFKGKLYPVNLKPGKVNGISFIQSVDQVESVDLAIIAVPSKFVTDEMNKLASMGTKNVIVITAGFREEGEDGRLAEQQMLDIAKKNKMRVVGPNCFGVIDTHSSMNATFSSLLPPKGNVALGSQSGAVGATMLDWSRESFVGISKFVSLGNKMDIKESDLIRTFDKDRETKVIGIYTEGISDGEEFMRSVAGMRTKKPIIVLKSGRTSAGSRAASSHTGALAGSDSVYDAVFKKLNIIRAKDVDEMFDLFTVFSLSGKMEKDGVAIITNAGGLGVMAADACSDSSSVRLAELSLETMDRIVKEIPSAASELNPIDLRGDAKNSDIEKALRIVSKDSGVGAALLLASPLDMIDLNAIAERLCAIRNEIDIPIAVSFAGGNVAEEASDILRKGGIPTFPTPDRAVLALSALRSFSLGSDVSDELVPLPDASGRKEVLSLIRKLKKEDRSSLSEEEGKKILRAYGIPVPPESRASDITEAADAAGKIGYPVVMKILSPDIHHKTDVGGVVVNIKDDSSLRIAYESMIARCRMAVPDAKIDGVSIQRMVSGQEVIVSMIRDDQFGPVISFGLGGIYVEILKEISQTVLPMSRNEFERLMTATKAYRLLSGARGKPPADIGSLKDIILRLAKIAEENPEIYELEINPVMVNERSKGSWAVDALVTLR